MIVGLVGGSVGIACMGVAPDGLTFALALFPNAIWGLAMPTLQSLMTQRVSEQEQGQLQGANASIAGITGLIGPGLYSAVFAWSLRDEATQHMPGLAILVAGALMALGFFLSLRFARAAPAEEPQPA